MNFQSAPVSYKNLNNAWGGSNKNDCQVLNENAGKKRTLKKKTERH